VIDPMYGGHRVRFAQTAAAVSVLSVDWCRDEPEATDLGLQPLPGLWTTVASRPAPPPDGGTGRPV